MSAVKPIIRELKQAALKGGVHARDRLHQLTDNMNDHLDSVVRQVRDNDRFDNAIDVSLKRFKRNPKHDSAEYNSQYNEQMDTLQNMSAADWLRNRIEYLDNGRTSDSLRAQQAARDAALNDKYDELRDEGLSVEQAQQAAAEWLKGQAALHRLDGIAGGDVTDISRVGDTRINSSLGSQWRTRVGDIDTAIIDYVNANPGVDLNDVNINVILR
ncbi:MULTISPECIES: polymorphic toxin type 15 domain-containing protein [unclassified Microbacterium]|uniref:polymorphic toxin type 15 domain-containing protein n=1 Tax=unclassified Microbacterium TaxID=2609290 RepID=UPI001FAF9EE4|nr:polymorphic toxin type 15 domain-containing protein [Microbacterium sp. TPD7012]